MGYLNREQFIETMNMAMDSLGWDRNAQNKMRFHIENCSEDLLKDYQEEALSNDKFVDFNEMQQIMRERLAEAEAHHSLIHDVKPVSNINVSELTPAASHQIKEDLDALVQSGKIDKQTAISIFTIAHYGGQQAYSDNLSTKDKIMERVNVAKQDPQFQNFSKQIVVDPQHKMIMVPESQQDVALRTIFGANNYAGMTNINCMPIVKFHGELAELGGEIKGVNRDLKDDTQMWQRNHIKTYSFTEAYGTMDPVAKFQRVDVAPEPGPRSAHLNTPKPRPGN